MQMKKIVAGLGLALSTLTLGSIYYASRLIQGPSQEAQNTLAKRNHLTKAASQGSYSQISQILSDRTDLTNDHLDNLDSNFAKESIGDEVNKGFAQLSPIGLAELEKSEVNLAEEAVQEEQEEVQDIQRDNVSLCPDLGIGSDVNFSDSRFDENGCVNYKVISTADMHKWGFNVGNEQNENDAKQAPSV